MKTTKKTLVIAVILLMANSISFAQTDKENQTLKEYTQPPKSTEIVVGIITGEIYGGSEYDYYEWNSQARWSYTDRKGKDHYEGAYQYSQHKDYTNKYTDEQLLQKLMEAANTKKHTLLFH